MELLLNLLWLLLVMPAFWLWHYSRTAQEKRNPNPFHTLFALACLLVVLFPVISATDDMQAMRAEIEESSSKKSICQTGIDKPHSSKWQFQPCLVSAEAAPVLPEMVGGLPPASSSLTRSACFVPRAGRAPPRSFLA